MSTAAALVAHATAAQAQAETVLRDRLSPAQAADVTETDWFVVRDQRGDVWRIYAGTTTTFHPRFEDPCEVILPSVQPFPNLIDQNGRGRTMHATPYYDLGMPGHLPMPSLALGLLLHLGDPELTQYIHDHACHSPARVPPPQTRFAHYAQHGEAGIFLPSTEVPSPPMDFGQGYARRFPPIAQWSVWMGRRP